jgi:putative nucleotidyltransferase with HDIG domain
MTQMTAPEFVQRAKDLPVMPPMAAEIMKKAEDPDCDVKSIADLIARDAALAVRVLKIANSSFYSMPRKIESIQQSVVLLGFTTLRSVVVAASLKDVFARYGLSERLLWEHAVGAACAASTLAEHVGGFTPDEVFVGGLLHDVGKLVMHAEAERQYQEVLRAVYADESTSIQAELDVFGFDHAEVGRLTLEKWSLPERLVHAVAGHHDLSRADPDSGGRPLAALLHIADLMALHEGHGRRTPNPTLDILPAEMAGTLGLRDASPDALLAEFREAYAKEKAVFA